MMAATELLNFVGATWRRSRATERSFFGDLHGRGRDAVDFYTDKKVVIERWPREWSRAF
jgi:hypothetical protein